MKRPPLTILSHAATIPQREREWNAHIPSSVSRRSPRIWQLAMVAAQRVCAAVPRQPRSVLAATALGALDETRLFLDSIFVSGFASPRNFIASVHNSMAGKLATDLSIHGTNLTFCEGANSLAAALVAAQLLESDDLPVLIVAVEEHLELLDTLSPHLAASCHPWFGSPGWPDGALALVCDRNGRGPSIAAAGPCLVADRCRHQACASLHTSLDLRTVPLPPLEQTSTSPFAPSLAIADALDRLNEPVRIGSYTPSSTAVAVVDLMP